MREVGFGYSPLPIKLRKVFKKDTLSPDFGAGKPEKSCKNEVFGCKVFTNLGL